MRVSTTAAFCCYYFVLSGVVVDGFAPSRIPHQQLSFVAKKKTALHVGVQLNDAPPAKTKRSVALEPSSSPPKPVFATEVVLADDDDSSNTEEFQKGFAIIALITLFNASLSPLWHTVYQGNGPPPLFLNAIVSIVAFVGLVLGGSLLDSSVESMSALKDNNEEETKWSTKSFRGGIELGFWKGLGAFVRSFVRLDSSCSTVVLCMRSLTH